MPNKKGFGGVIFRASKTVNGVKIYAKDYGLRGFPIYIGGDSEQKKTTFEEKVVSVPK